MDDNLMTFYSPLQDGPKADNSLAKEPVAAVEPQPQPQVQVPVQTPSTSPVQEIAGPPGREPGLQEGNLPPDNQAPEAFDPSGPPPESINFERLEEFVPEIATYLSNKGFMEVIPEGIDTESFSLDALSQTLEYNLKAKQQMKMEEGIKYEQDRLGTKLNPMSLQLIDYNLNNPNADDADIKDFIETLVNVDSITALDPEINSEQIVREYYKSNQWTSDEIEEKIGDLKERKSLVKEAHTVKPKLDAKAQGIAQAKSEQVRQIKEFENGLHQQLQEKTISILNQGKLNGIDISREEADFLYSAIMNDEVPVNMKGKTIEMGFAEALVRQQKYAQNGNLENLMLGLLVIQQGPNAVEKFFARKARTKETENFIKQRKFGIKRSGNVQAPSKPGELSTGIKFNM